MTTYQSSNISIFSWFKSLFKSKKEVIKLEEGIRVKSLESVNGFSTVTLTDGTSIKRRANTVQSDDKQIIFS